MKILHCVIDEKFIDNAINLYETDKSVTNDYIIIQDKKTDYVYITDIRIRSVSEKNFLSISRDYDVVILHSLFSVPYKLIPQIDKKIKVCWFAWGWDLYEGMFPVVPINLYGPQTKRFLFPQIIKNQLKKIFSISQRERHSYFNQILSRIDYFSGVFPYEYDLVKKYNRSFHPRCIDFYYGSPNFFIPEDPETKIENKKTNIIIGNSANVTNNHLDVIKLLSELDLKLSENSKIIIPLSYGSGEKYKEKVECEASKVFGNKVFSLRTFMPLEEYIHLISNCKIAIFGHERQQASDNIFLQLLYGAKVFMSETSCAYGYLKSIGLHVYSLQRDKKEFYTGLKDDLIIENRRILSSVYSSSKLIERVRKINRTFQLENK